MFINGQSLLNAAPIENMAVKKLSAFGTSYGLVEAGYDIRIQEKIIFSMGSRCWSTPCMVTAIMPDDSNSRCSEGRFILASSMERFQMPKNLVGILHDKSSWARQGLSVFAGTVIEPGWNGILTLELVFNGNHSFTIPAGAGIAQVLFGRLSNDGDYEDGKYQDAPGLQEAK